MTGPAAGSPRSKVTQSRAHVVCELQAEMFLARPRGAWAFANGLATPRAHSMKIWASGLSVRFLSVMIPIGLRVVGSWTGNTLIAAGTSGNLVTEAGTTAR